MFGSNPDLWWAIIFCFAFLTMMGLRHRIAAWFRRAEANKLKLRDEQARQASDPLAHFYMTVAEIDGRTPQPESFERFGRTIWKFEGKNHLNHQDADEARRQAVLREARAFYQDVDRLRLGRR